MLISKEFLKHRSIRICLSELYVQSMITSNISQPKQYYVTCINQQVPRYIISRVIHLIHLLRSKYFSEDFVSKHWHFMSFNKSKAGFARLF